MFAGIDIGAPLEGFKRLLVEIRTFLASSIASSVRGTWTAI